MNDARDEPRNFRRELLIACGVALVGALAAAPVTSAGGSVAEPRASSAALLVWLAIIAPAAGCACSSLGVGVLPFGATVPAAWLALIESVDAFAPRQLPTPWWGAAVVAGLFFAGAAVGRFVVHPAFGVGLLALGAAGLVALPGVRGVEWSPTLASLALDLSPATLVCESAGLDWMRHPSVYGFVGTDRFEREAWSGALAGPLALVVGCAASWLAARAANSRRGSSR